MAYGDEDDAQANKRLKTLEPPPLQPSAFDSGKGRSEIEISESEDDEEAELYCGICLLDAGNGGDGIIQGCTDSCDHLFCFVCIMEWSKVESKCPICKCRFSTIRRPARPPVFPSERIVTVPIRDQVHYAFGNVTTGPYDPHAEVRCNVCHSSTDDYLIMLCELCNTSCHTYCVGLGATLPEGDWFCTDCNLLRSEHEKTDTRDDCDNQRKFVACHQISETGESVSIFDIVREPQPQPQTSYDDGDPLASSRTKMPTKTSWSCLDAHDRVRVLRENWSELRSGSMRFPSSKNHEGKIAEQKTKAGGRSNVIDKAWKMRDIASKKMNTHAKAGGVHSNSLSSHRQQLGTNHVGYIQKGSPRQYHLQNKNYSMHKSQMPGQRQAQKKVTLNGSLNVEESFSGKMNTCTVGGGGHSNSLSSHRQHIGFNHVGGVNIGQGCFLTTHSASHSKLTSSKEDRAVFQPDASDKTEYVEKKDLRGTSSMMSAHTVSSVSHAEEGLCAKPLKDKVVQERIGETRKAKDVCGAKTEIQSLVKLNLKLLSGNKKLAKQKFKKIARLATHSILASCGFEHRRHGIRSLPNSICIHDNSDSEFRRSTLMPNSCRECVYVFVKDVVNAIMLERKGRRR